MRAAAGILGRFALFLQDAHPEVRCVARIGRREIESYKGWLRSNAGRSRPLAVATVRAALSTLRMFCERIIEWGWEDAPIRVAIFAGDMPKADEPLPKFLDDPTFALFMRAVRADPRPLARLVVEPLPRTGMRVGEVCALEADAVVRIGETHWLRIPVGKLHNDRYIPRCKPQLVELLAERSEADGANAYGPRAIDTLPAMLTQNTTLSLVNFSGKKITSTAITIEDSTTNWDGPPSRPDKNFTGPLAANDSRSERAEIAKYPNSVGCWFKISLTFADHSTLSFRANQVDAYAKQSGVYTESLVKSPENAHLEVFRRTGESRYLYTNAYYIRPAAAPDNSTWMGELLAKKPNVTLNNLTMPGSHDAGMYRPGVTEKSNTQSLDIGGQLQAGARYFDLRVCASGSELWTNHGPSYGGKLDDILDDVKKFLASGSKEVVFLKFRSVDDPYASITYHERDRQGTVDLVKSKLKGLLYTADETPHFAKQKLSDLAGDSGRVVAVFNSQYDGHHAPKDGIFPYIDYGNEDTGEEIVAKNHNNLGVYDAYSHQSEFSVMQKDQHAKWAAHGGYGKDYLFLLSWTLTGSTDNILDLDLLSATANPQMPRALHTIAAERLPEGLPNIVYIDQVDPYLCKAIIDHN